MNVDIKEAHAGQIEISVPQVITVDDLGQWRRLVSQLLMLAFSDKRIGLVTIEPQSYSLGFEIDDPSTMFVDDKMVLVNVLPDSRSEVLHQIAQSEEFNRGLLRIFGTEAASSSSLSEVHIRGALRGGKNGETPKPLLYCDDDGLILYWVDDHPPLQQIRASASL
jgi:hypothetical protein